MKASASPISARESGDRRLLTLDPSPVPSIVSGARKVLLQRWPGCQWAALFLVETPSATIKGDDHGSFGQHLLKTHRRTVSSVEMKSSTRATTTRSRWLRSDSAISPSRQRNDGPTKVLSPICLIEALDESIPLPPVTRFCRSSTVTGKFPWPES